MAEVPSNDTDTSENEATFTAWNEHKNWNVAA